MDTTTDIDLLLIGKTGNGKSAVGNAILKDEYFETNSSTSSLTNEMSCAVAEYKNKKIKVVDGPGVGDTRFNVDERTKQMDEWLNKAIQMNDRGYHAFLLAFKFGSRFTDEEIEVLQFLKRTFGDDFAKKHCVIVMTFGDNFHKETRTSKMAFEQWCNDQKGAFHDLLDECNGRIVLFNKYAEGNELDEQIDRLLKVVESLGERYTHKLFVEAAKLRKKTWQKKPFIAMDVLEEISLITQALIKEIPRSGDPEHSSRLGELSKRCEGLIRRVPSQLGDLKEKVNSLKHSINLTHLTEKQRAEDRKKIETEMEKVRISREALEAKLKEEEDARRKAEKRTSMVEEAIRRERQQREDEMKKLKEDQQTLGAELKTSEKARKEAENRAVDVERKMETIKKQIRELEVKGQEMLSKEAKERAAAEKRLSDAEKIGRDERQKLLKDLSKLRKNFDDNLEALEREKKARAQADEEVMKLEEEMREKIDILARRVGEPATSTPSRWEKIGNFIIRAMETAAPIVGYIYKPGN